MSNEFFLNNYQSEFLKEVTGKKLVLFGASEQMKEALKKFIKPNDLRVAYAVDNDYRRWYSTMFGIDIYEPERLKSEDSGNTIVLITSRYPFRIEKQIKTYGVKMYYSWHLFLEEHIGRYQFMVFF